MIRLVTDSASMIPPALRQRFDGIVVPLTITLDGSEWFEGAVDDDIPSIDIDHFYARLAAGAIVSTSAPAPGAFLAAYQRAADEGATAVLSVHTGSNYSATIASATVAAGMSALPVEIVDTSLVSFPVTLCLWAAAEALASGADIAAAAEAARTTAAGTGSVFVVGVPRLAEQGGRFVSVDGEIAPTSILELDRNGMHEIDRVDDIDAAVDRMVTHVEALALQRPLRLGVGHALRANVAEVMVQRLAGMPGVLDTVVYEVGPSVGAHTGAGTVGVVYATPPPST